jgi:predicted nucleic acid-binding protein
LKKVVIDTGPLLAFAKAGIVDALKNLFKQLIIIGEVYIEVFSKKSPENNIIKENIGKFIQVHDLHELIRIDDEKIKEAVQMLDEGEKSSILLSHFLIKDMNKVLLIIDEKSGRKAAGKLGIPVVGTVWLLKTLQQGGWIDDAVLVSKEMRKKGYHLSDALIDYLINNE